MADLRAYCTRAWRSYTRSQWRHRVDGEDDQLHEEYLGTRKTLKLSICRAKDEKRKEILESLDRDPLGSRSTTTSPPGSGPRTASCWKWSKAKAGGTHARRWPTRSKTTAEDGAVWCTSVGGGSETQSKARLWRPLRISTSEPRTAL